jgi:hypothetical protein
VSALLIKLGGGQASSFDIRMINVQSTGCLSFCFAFPGVLFTENLKQVHHSRGVPTYHYRLPPDRD